MFNSLEGIFEINSYEMDDIFGNMNKTSAELDTSNSESKQDFVSMKQSRVFGNGIETINEQMDEITNSMMMMSNTIQKGTQAIFETEFKLLQEVSDIQIPNGFETNDIASSVTTSSVTLKKRDGESINNGNSSSQVDLDFNSTINSKETLNEMKESDTSSKELDESAYDVDKKVLKDIIKGESLKEDIELYRAIKSKENLRELKHSDTSETKLDEDIFSPEKKELKDIKKQESQQVELSDDNQKGSEIKLYSIDNSIHIDNNKIGD